MTPGDFDGPRLSQHGSELEQSVLAAAREDAPHATPRNAAIARVLAESRAERRRRVRVGVAVGVSALAVAAGVLLVPRHVPSVFTNGDTSGQTFGMGPAVLVTPEPHASAPASVKPPAPAASSASPLAPCTPALVAEGKNPLIDDFEDGDAHVPLLEHRAGQWLTYNDGTANESPAPGKQFLATRIPGGRGESHFGVHNVGGKFSKWGANLSLTLNPHHCYDASAYAGIQFWARGRGEIRAVVKVTQVVTEEFGGTCQHDCFDVHSKIIKLSKEFERVTVRWEELRQLGFGEPVAFDPHSLDGIDFAVRPEETPFDFWIDDVSFLPR